MTAILRATAVLSGSSLVTILAGLASAKVWAVLVGPDGVGLRGLLQSLVGLAGLAAGLGVGVGLVRLGAQALEQASEVGFAALKRAAWLLFWTVGGLAALLLVLFRVPVSRVMLGGSEYAGDVALMSVALLFSLAAGLETGTLNAHHRVTALAKVGALQALVGAALGVGLVWVWGERGIAAAVLGATLVSWLVARGVARREVGVPTVRPDMQAVRNAAGRLLRFGGPYSLSMLAGYGVQLALPVLVLALLGREDVGYYRAATTISLTYLGFLLQAMAQDYFPRVSAAADDPETLAALVNQQHRLVMLLGVPMILGTLALAPYLVPLIYSPAFTPTVQILEWQLVGDILKFSSWTMSFVILARGGSQVFLATETVGGLTRLLTSWLGMRWFGLAGLGMSHLATYVVYFAVVALLVRKEIGLVWSVQNRMLLLAGLAAALMIRALAFSDLGGLEPVVALAVALLAGAGSAYAIWQEMGGKYDVERG